MNYYIVLDTETLGSVFNPIPYDIGYAVIDEEGNVYASRSYVVKEVYDEYDMSTAYYASKIPQYEKDIASKKRHKVSISTVKRQLYKDCAKYDITEVIAHNAPFDKRSTHNAMVELTKYKTFLPSYCEFKCSLKMARQTFGKDADYIKFCEENGYMTNHKKPRVRLTAEILHRYLTGDNEFVESHTGLEDVMIEKDIFVKCREMGA